ncbi:DUF4190 domain-containing protein [Blastococcus sp. SYSU D00695]
MSSDGELYRGDPPPQLAPPPVYGQHYGPPPGYGTPPGYPPPGYAPPGYGSPPGWPPGYGHRRPTNGLAIASLVLAFMLPPVGLGLGLAARRQIRETGEEGDGLALAGAIVGGIGTGIYVLGILFFVVVASTVSFGP